LTPVCAKNGPNPVFQTKDILTKAFFWNFCDYIFLRQNCFGKKIFKKFWNFIWKFFEENIFGNSFENLLFQTVLKLSFFEKENILKLFWKKGFFERKNSFRIFEFFEKCSGQILLKNNFLTN
jgi:hypothetical protein